MQIKKEMNKIAIDKFMTTLFILRANNNIYKEIKQDFQTQFALGNNQWSATIEKAINIMKMQ